MLVFARRHNELDILLHNDWKDEIQIVVYMSKLASAWKHTQTKHTHLYVYNSDKNDENSNIQIDIKQPGKVEYSKIETKKLEQHKWH